MTDTAHKIFGYDWSDIQRAQSRGSLNSPVSPKQEMKAGNLVRYRDVNLWPRYTNATVVSVKGNMAMVRWPHMQEAVEEWIPNLIREAA